MSVAEACQSLGIEQPLRIRMYHPPTDHSPSVNLSLEFSQQSSERLPLYRGALAYQLRSHHIGRRLRTVEGGPVAAMESADTSIV
jgi:hypothetical protein